MFYKTIDVPISLISTLSTDHQGLFPLAVSLKFTANTKITSSTGKLWIKETISY